MININSNFFKDVERHQANAKDLVKYIEFWHNTKNLNKSIYDFLGCSKDQYALLVEGMPDDNWVQHVLNSRSKPINFQSLCSSAKELYEFNASNLGGGMFYHDYVAFHHGDTLYSVRDTKTGVISLIKAECAMNAIEAIEKVKHKNPIKTENVCVIDKLMSELEDTQTLFDNNRDQLPSNPSSKDISRIMELSMRINILKEVIDLIDNIDGGSKKHIISTVSGIKNRISDEPTDERSEYSEFELWAYERYKLEWCVQHNVLLKDVDEEVGINGGECYVCINEFIDNEFEDYNTYFHKCYVLERLLDWILKCLGSPYSIFENELDLTAEEISAFTSNSQFDSSNVFFNVRIEERERRVDVILTSTFTYLKSIVEDIGMNFVMEFVLDMGIDLEFIQSYVDIGFIPQNELYSRLVNLENRGKAIGAECVIMPYNDGGHLSCFWYPQSMVAYILYKGFAAEFFVKGDVEAYLYDSSGYIKRHIVRSAKNVGIREDETTCKLIQNDVVLSALEKTGTLDFLAHPWVELQIRNVKENKIVKKSILVNDNVLFDVENNFDDIIKTIDRYKRKKEKKNDYKD